MSVSPMSFDYQSSKRDFVHVHTDIPIRYKFLSESTGTDLERNL